MFKRKMMLRLLPALLASLSGCGVAGDFCDVVKSPLEFDNGTALQIVKTNRPEAEQIATQNEYGQEYCDWGR